MDNSRAATNTQIVFTYVILILHACFGLDVDINLGILF